MSKTYAHVQYASVQFLAGIFAGGGRLWLLGANNEGIVVNAAIMVWLLYFHKCLLIFYDFGAGNFLTFYQNFQLLFFTLLPSPEKIKFLKSAALHYSHIALILKVCELKCLNFEFRIFLAILEVHFFIDVSCYVFQVL